MFYVWNVNVGSIKCECGLLRTHARGTRELHDREGSTREAIVCGDHEGEHEREGDVRATREEHGREASLSAKTAREDHESEGITRGTREELEREGSTGRA